MGQRILIIDDSLTEITALTNILRGAEGKDYKVYAVKTGEEGIDMAIKLRPHLILMDVVLPKMSGFQATRKLLKAEETANIPVIIVSTKGQDSDKQWGMRQGAKDYLVKPVNARELLTAVENALSS